MTSEGEVRAPSEAPFKLPVRVSDWSFPLGAGVIDADGRTICLTEGRNPHERAHAIARALNAEPSRAPGVEDGGKQIAAMLQIMAIVEMHLRDIIGGSGSSHVAAQQALEAIMRGPRAPGVGEAAKDAGPLGSGVCVLRQIEPGGGGWIYEAEAKAILAALTVLPAGEVNADNGSVESDDATEAPRIDWDVDESGRLQATSAGPEPRASEPGEREGLTAREFDAITKGEFPLPVPPAGVPEGRDKIAELRRRAGERGDGSRNG